MVRGRDKTKGQVRLNAKIPWVQISLSRGVVDTPVRRWCSAKMCSIHAVG